MSITPLKITGTSSFSADLNLIIKRAVDIATLPVKLLQNQQSDLITKKAVLSSFNTKLQTLAGIMDRLGALGESKSLSATTSNANRVSVVLNGASLPASYSITEITSVAGAASENTASGYATADATAVDVDNNLELVLGGTQYAIDLTSYGNNLNGLRDAINALGIGVTASVLNTGEGGNPYYLTLSATATGETTLQLRTAAGDSGSNILTSANQGTNAEFKLNGLQFSRSDNVVTDAIDGLTFTIVDETAVGETVVLTLASSRGSVASALQDLVSAYNDVRGSINQHMGENAGLLSGDAVLRQMQSVLQKITGHQGSGTIKSLAQLGISLDKTGVMSFDSSAFYALSSTSFHASFDLLGSPSTGLGALASSVEQLSDPVTGLIKTQQNNYDLADTRISKTITEMAERIERMQLTLSAKLQQADVLLSTLQSQQDTLTAALQSLSVISFGKQEK